MVASSSYVEYNRVNGLERSSRVSVVASSLTLHVEHVCCTLNSSNGVIWEILYGKLLRGY